MIEVTIVEPAEPFRGQKMESWSQYNEVLSFIEALEKYSPFYSKFATPSNGGDKKTFPEIADIIEKDEEI